MGLEGAVRLGYRKQLEAQPEGPARAALLEQLLGQEYAKGSALNMTATLEIDAVIDPADTRDWLVSCGLRSMWGWNQKLYFRPTSRPLLPRLSTGATL